MGSPVLKHEYMAQQPPQPVRHRAKELFTESRRREHANWRQYLQEIQRVAESRCIKWRRGYADAWAMEAEK